MIQAIPYTRRTHYDVLAKLEKLQGETIDFESIVTIRDKEKVNSLEGRLIKVSEELEPCLKLYFHAPKSKHADSLGNVKFKYSSGIYNFFIGEHTISVHDSISNQKQ